MCLRKQEIWYIVAAGVSREKSLLAKHACVSQEWPNESEADFSFYGPWDSVSNERIEAAETGL